MFSDCVRPSFVYPRGFPHFGVTASAGVADTTNTESDAATASRHLMASDQSLATLPPPGDTRLAMSQENIELVRRATAAYNRGDLDGFLQDWAPDAVLDWSNSRGVDAGVLRGHDEIRGFVERFLAAWDEVRIDLLNDPEEVKDGLLVAENVTYLRGRDGVEVEARSAWLVTIRNGEQTSLTLYQTKQEALEAVGLRE